MPGFVRALADRVSGVAGHAITNCLANLYENGDAQMGFHSDSAAGIVAGTSTSIVSVGGERELTFRSKDSSRRLHVVRLQPGSLLIMPASVQELWKHAVLPTREAAARISLTFRHIAARGEVGG
ncbi:MAG: alpha-ketoglutarate-dependent dioxygenase AlkB [Polyangiaceae bacterium]